MSSESGSGALDAGNHFFHEAYEGARDGVREQVAIFVVSPTELVLHHRGQRQAIPYSSASFAAAKSAAHLAVALFALTCAEVEPEHSREGVVRLLGPLTAALGEQLGPKAQEIQAEIAELLQSCLGYAQASRERLPAEERRARFASEAGPRILKITELATREQVAGLHGAAETFLRALSTEDQASLQMVVVGDHQARTRSLGMQYFKRRLEEPAGEDVRVTYGENITDEQEAISLVATRRLDKSIAQAFFGDDARLQRDVLGDAAKRALEQMSFPSSVPGE